jgi:hypothetical protein
MRDPVRPGSRLNLYLAEMSELPLVVRLCLELQIWCAACWHACINLLDCRRHLLSLQRA